MKNAIRVAAVGATLALSAVSLAACSSSPGGGDANAGNDTGPITYVQGKDTSGVVKILADTWNKAHPKEKVTVKQQTDQADQQLQDLTQHFQQSLSDYDVVSVDVVWTAQLAAKQYLQPLTGAYAIKGIGDMLPSVTDSGKYVGVQYAAPSSTDSQLLYYRKDLLGDKPVPKTFADMMALCPIAKKAGIDCYAGQFAKYEGLTVNFNEVVTSNGGSIVDDKGAPTLDTPQAKAGLQELVDAFKNGNIPKAAVTYQEQQGLNSFETGKLMFLNNWPYMVADIANNKQADPIRSKYAIAGYPGNSAVGGHNLAISKFSKHKATAAKFIAFMESEATQQTLVEKASLAPVRTAMYQDTALTTKYPYLTALKASLDNAKARPISPYYNGVTQAIQNNVFQALQTASTGGSVDVDKTLSATSEAIKAASSN